MNVLNIDKILDLVEDKLTTEEKLKLLEHLKSFSDSTFNNSMKLAESRLVIRTFSAACCGSLVILPLAVFSKNLLLGTVVGSIFVTLIFYGMDQLANLLSKWRKKDGK